MALVKCPYMSGTAVAVLTLFHVFLLFGLSIGLKTLPAIQKDEAILKDKETKWDFNLFQWLHMELHCEPREKILCTSFDTEKEQDHF